MQAIEGLNDPDSIGERAESHAVAVGKWSQGKVERDGREQSDQPGFVAHIHARHPRESPIESKGGGVVIGKKIVGSLVPNVQSKRNSKQEPSETVIRFSSEMGRLEHRCANGKIVLLTELTLRIITMQTHTEQAEGCQMESSLH